MSILYGPRVMTVSLGAENWSLRMFPVSLSYIGCTLIGDWILSVVFSTMGEVEMNLKLNFRSFSLELEEPSF